MPAKSESQQRLMGMALAAKRGKGHFSGKVNEVAESMSEKQLKDFAKTKHEGLPEKKSSMNTLEQAYINGFFKRASEQGFSQTEAIELLKKASPGVAPQHTNDLGAALATKAKGPVGPTYSGGIETMPSATRQALRLPTPPPAVPPQHANDLGRFTR